MHSQLLLETIALRSAQAFGAVALALAVVWLAHRASVRLQPETKIALVRGIGQILLVGMLLTFVFGAARWLSALVLLAMMLAAALISSRRVRHIPGILRVTGPAIFIGAGLVISLMVVLGVIEAAPATLVPVGSMIIANAMNTAALALERFRAEVEAHPGQIEAALALGAAPAVAVAPYARAAVRASVIPNLNNLRSLGIVWIPGLMAGMVIAGGNPVVAAIYQFTVVTMLFATAGVTALICTQLVRSRAFSAAGQLTLRPLKSEG